MHILCRHYIRANRYIFGCQSTQYNTLVCLEIAQKFKSSSKTNNTNPCRLCHRKSIASNSELSPSKSLRSLVNYSNLQPKVTPSISTHRTPTMNRKQMMISTNFTNTKEKEPDFLTKQNTRQLHDQIISIAKTQPKINQKITNVKHTNKAREARE